MGIEASNRYLDLEKHWRSLYFLFTGNFPYDSENKSDTLLHKVFRGGTATPWEATYGMVRYLTVSEVHEMAEALAQISTEKLQSELDKLLDFDESKAYIKRHLLHLYTQLVEFFNKAAPENNIVLLSFD